MAETTAGFAEERRRRQPRFRRAVLADARFISAKLGQPLDGAPDGRVALEALRLAWRSDGFLGQVLYRAKARLQGLGVPVLPRVIHRLAMASSQICIGDPVVIRPGVHLVHGQIVIDGMTDIKPGATISPFVTIGLRSGELAGPRLEANVTIGSGARVLGPIEIGMNARIGANAVVLEDVPARATVIGVPARVVRERTEAEL
jgi:serine O-acetyltransferase